MKQKRTIEELLATPVMEMTGEELTRVQNFSKKGQRGMIATLLKAGKGKALNMAADIKKLADLEEEREEIEEQTSEILSEMAEKLREQNMLKNKTTS